MENTQNSQPQQSPDQPIILSKIEVSEQSENDPIVPKPKIGLTILLILGLIILTYIIMWDILVLVSGFGWGIILVIPTAPPAIIGIGFVCRGIAKSLGNLKGSKSYTRCALTSLSIAFVTTIILIMLSMASREWQTCGDTCSNGTFIEALLRTLLLSVAAYIIPFFVTLSK